MGVGDWVVGARREGGVRYSPRTVVDFVIEKLVETLVLALGAIKQNA